MWKRSLLLAVLGLLASSAFAQGGQADPASQSTGYIRCPAGQANVFLYETVTVFQVVSNPKCGDQVEILGRVDTLNGYLRVRTADGNEGFVPQDQVSSDAPRKTRVAAPAPPPQPVAAAQAPRLSGPLATSSSSSTGTYTYDVPKVEVFGGYSYLSQDWESLASRSSLHGWNASAAFNLRPWLGVEGGATGNYQRNCLATTGMTCSIFTVMGGPRVTTRPGLGFTAFGHGLVGLGALGMNASGTSLTWRDLAWAIGGGADYAVNERISIRVGQVDYVRTQLFQSLGGTNQNNIRVSAGVVLRIGKVVTE